MRSQHLAVSDWPSRRRLLCRQERPREAEAPWKIHAIDHDLSGGDGVRLNDADGDRDLAVTIAGSSQAPRGST